MLCQHCKTVVEFAKEDYVKMVFQNGTKFLFHMECFNLEFQRTPDVPRADTRQSILTFEDDIHGGSHATEKAVPTTRLGALDTQGNGALGSNEFGDA